MRWAVVVAVLSLPGLAGCRTAPVAIENPASVLNANYDVVWDTTVRVVERTFDVAYENRYDGRIETFPETASTLLEPWRPDAPTFRDRVQASLQTIRRRAFVLIQPAPNGGFTITLEIYKELEDLPNPIFATFSGGTFIRSLEPIPERVVDSGVAPSTGWISLGRDELLERQILAEIQSELDGIDIAFGP